MYIGGWWWWWLDSIYQLCICLGKSRMSFVIRRNLMIMSGYVRDNIAGLENLGTCINKINKNMYYYCI